ncbi:ricin-type beta-trefoil lectin domain protein [Umezawaea sp. Da 62-37]|uniref:ricin-type beta-trefoil lectin domain protein n=1 Tax=Umezawaea sp. Da 62-37 TaxID=3075927 RepID=UPI0028F6DC23|nr:ricin-type beta-trefoil lectin domain protein [Umezawaea sp. Da 62-37]WNV85185.1 glycoside hydrolase family 97 catalytic domain-containing protein [Umezawaea sp. Da 62-37]
MRPWKSLLHVALTLTIPAAFLTATAAPASAATSWTVAGPSTDSPTSALVSLDNGTPTFGVSDRGRTVLSPSPIGIETATADLTRNLTFTARRDRTITEAYTMTTGKQRSRSTSYTETTLSFTGVDAARLDVVVRVSNTGAAYRYVLPGSGSVTVRREASSWTLPTSSNAWVVPPDNEDQGVWLQTTAGGAPDNDYRVPALFEVGGTFALVAETDLDGRYAAASLTHRAGSGTYTTSLAGGTVTASLPLSTPWRTAAIGDLRTVTESTIVDDLAPPSRVGDTSWVKPGTVAWSWLTEHASPSSADRQKQYIDFAQRNGWGYVLIDEGWQSNWAPEVIAYAKARGVQVVLWFNSADLRTAQQRENWLPLVKSWGAAGLKIDFSYEYTQPTLQWYDAVLARTADLKLMVNFHGTATPRGLQRTWPQVMTAEAVYGAEQFHNRAALNTILPFTRNAISSMDYTPVVFSMTDRDTTDAHELATAIVFESGWQHDADNPAAYEARPEALRVLDQLPAAWDETRLLGGRPGQEAYLARRNGSKWYLGGVSALAQKTFQTPLGFLGSGQWLLETVRDGTGTLLRETRVVTNSDTLSVPIATRGGFASVVCPYVNGMTTCGSGNSGGVLKGVESGLCVDVPGGSTTNGTAVALWDCNGGTNQSWTSTPSKQLQVYGTKCLDVNGAGTADGTIVQIYDCNGSSAQEWTVDDNGGLVNTGSGKCLDTTGHGTTNGTRLAIRTCTGGANQHWARTATPGLLKGGQSGRCVDVPNSDQANGTRPALWDCNGGGNQSWTSTSSNQLMVFATKCLDAAGGATADGTAVQIYDCNGSSAQQWRVRSDGSVVGVGSGKCLDAYDNGTTNGTRLILWPCGGTANQQWARG